MMRKKPTSLFLNPPWKVLAGALAAAGFCVCGCLRLSELGGTQVQEACRAALLLIFGAGLCGAYPILMGLGGSAWNLMAGTFVGSVIRLTVVVIGLVVLMLFTRIHTLWLLVFCGGTYAMVLMIDTLLAIGLMRFKQWNEDNE